MMTYNFVMNVRNGYCTGMPAIAPDRREVLLWQVHGKAEKGIQAEELVLFRIRRWMEKEGRHHPDSGSGRMWKNKYKDTSITAGTLDKLVKDGKAWIFGKEAFDTQSRHRPSYGYKQWKDMNTQFASLCIAFTAWSGKEQDMIHFLVPISRNTPQWHIVSQDRYGNLYVIKGRGKLSLPGQPYRPGGTLTTPRISRR